MVLVARKELISLLSHKQCGDKYEDIEKMLQSHLVKQQNPIYSWRSGLVQNEMAASGQVQGYRRLHSHAIKRIYLLMQDS